MEDNGENENFITPCLLFRSFAFIFRSCFLFALPSSFLLSLFYLKEVVPNNILVHLHSKFQVWAGPLTDQRLLVALWNRCSKAANITAAWGTLGLESSTSVSVRDLWKVRT